MAISNSVQSVIETSAKFARLVGSSQIETEHFLYGVLCDENCHATKILNKLGLDASVYKKVMIPYLKQETNERITGVGYSKSLMSIFAKTNDFCRKNGKETPEIEDILYIILQNPRLKATKSLSAIFKIDVKNLSKNLSVFIGVKEDEVVLNFEKKSVQKQLRTELPDALKNLGVNLTEKVTKNGMAKIIGRDEETARVIEILCRKTKNNPVLVGEAGVGKSSVVEGLAQRIVMGEVPELLQGKTIFSLDLASLMAGTKFRGSMEERLKNAIQAIQENDDILVFIDEIHMLGGASKDGEISPSDILKPYLARGELHCIGATTLDEYKKYIEKDPALERRFQTVKVDEPTEEDTIKILKGIKASFEKYHNVKITDDAIVSAVTLSTRYITNRNLPDKAIDLVDEACSKARVNASVMPEEVRDLTLRLYELDKQKEEYIQKQDFLKANAIKDQRQYIANEIEQIKRSMFEKTGRSFGEIGSDEIREVVASWTGVPVKKLTNTEREKLLNLEAYLSERVIGQPEAVSVVAKAIRRSSAGINDPKRPIGSFLFLGPTGVGKTELTKALAECLFDNEDNIVRFDMSEFMESHSVARLIGAPPGYVGHENGGELTEAVRKKPYSIVLFDEIEKAHPDIFNIMLQIFDEGRLTDSAGKVVNFKNTVIILTSNNGVQDLLARRKFEKAHPEEKRVETNEFLMNKLRDSFKPELLNRIDSVVIFDSLSKESVMKIADIMLGSLVKRLAKKNIMLKISDEAKMLVCDKGYDEIYGARPLKRVIDKEINDELAGLILDAKLEEHSAVLISASDKKFKFEILC